MPAIEKKHKVTFLDKNGVIVEVQNVEHGKYIKPKRIKKIMSFNGQYYKMSGWKGKVAYEDIEIRIIQKTVLSFAKKVLITFSFLFFIFLSTFVILVSVASAERTITYNTNGGTFNSNIKEKFNYWDSFVLPTPNHSELSFYGWYESPSFIGQQIIEVENRAKDLVLFARWYLPFSITFDSNGGNNIPSKFQQTMNGSIEKPTIPYKIGYTFVGWYLSEISNNGSGKKVYWPYTPSENMTLYAGWRANSYTVTLDQFTSTSYVVSFNVNGGSGSIPSQTITTNIGLKYPAIPTRTNYVFAGWYENSNTSGSPYNFTATVYSNKTLYAKWIPYSGAIGVMNIGTNYTLPLDVSSNLSYWAFVPLTTQTVTLGGYYTGDNQVYHGVYNSSKTLLNNNDGLYSLTAGTLYYYGLHTTSGTSESTSRIINGTAIPTSGGKVSGRANETKLITYGSDFELPIPTKIGSTFLGWYDGIGGTGKQYTNQYGQSVTKWDKASDAILYPKWG